MGKYYRITGLFFCVLFFIGNVCANDRLTQIDNLIKKYGKKEIIDFIITKSPNADITTQVENKLYIMGGRPSEEYVTARSINNDFKLLGLSVEQADLSISDFIFEKKHRAEKKKKELEIQIERSRAKIEREKEREREKRRAEIKRLNFNRVFKSNERELKIFCASQEDLFTYPNISEKVSDKRICKRFGITKKDLEQIYINVMTNMKGNPCIKARDDGVDGDVDGAWAYMQLFVEKRLKSPKTADFPYGGSRHVTHLGGSRYRVKSYVDAQNSFGANIRTHFEGVIKNIDGGWKLEYLNFEN